MCKQLLICMNAHACSERSICEYKPLARHDETSPRHLRDISGTLPGPRQPRNYSEPTIAACIVQCLHLLQRPHTHNRTRFVLTWARCACFAPSTLTWCRIHHTHMLACVAMSHMCPGHVFPTHLACVSRTFGWFCVQVSPTHPILDELHVCVCVVC